MEITTGLQRIARAIRLHRLRAAKRRIEARLRCLSWHLAGDALRLHDAFETSTHAGQWRVLCRLADIQQARIQQLQGGAP